MEIMEKKREEKEIMLKLRKKCSRCGEKAIRKWDIPFNKDEYFVCQDCLILLLELNLRWLKEHDWHNKILAYEAKFDKKEYRIKKKVKK
jgi:hypothetical protein